MLKYLLERKIAFLIVVFLAVLASSLNVGVAFLIKKIIDSITKMDIAGMLYLALGTLVYIVFVVLSDFLAHYSRDQFCKNVSCKLKDDLTASILNMSVVDKEEKSYADYQSLIISDVSTLEVNYFNALLAITYQLLNLLFSLAGIIYIQPRFLPVICLICVIPIIFPYFTKNKLEGLQANKSSTRSAYIDKLSDVLNGFRSIKFYNAEHKYKKYSADANKTYTNADISLSKHENLIMSSAYGVGLLIILLTWVSGAFFIKFGLLTFSSLVAMTKIAESIAGPFQIIGEKYTGIMSSLSIRKRLVSILNVPVKHTAKISFDSLTIQNTSITKQGKKCMSIDELVLSAGDRILVTGISGSGKSTLLNFIAGFEQDENTVFLLDGVKQDSNFSLSSSVIMLEQKTHVFGNSLIDNICMLDNTKTEKAKTVIADLKMGKLLPDIDKQSGSQKQFSGGEARRIDLGRLLVSDISEKIVLLDEPFSGLDNKNVKNVTEVINKLKPKLLIITGHNKENYNSLDYNRVLEIKDGRVYGI